MPDTLLASSFRRWPRHWPGLAPLLLLAAVLLVFSPVIIAGGFFWDDKELLWDNRWVKSSTGLWQIWFSIRNPDYFPLMSTSFWLEWRLWGNHAQGYHLTNALLHAGSAVLLWRILLRLAIPGAFLAALIFAIHPVNVESVAWIAERKNTLSLVLMLASVLLYFRAEDAFYFRWWGYIAGLVCFLLALLSKTSVVMLPVVLLILLAYRRQPRRHSDWVAMIPELLRLIPYFVLSLGLGLMTMFMQAHRAIGGTVIREDSLLARLAGAGSAIWFYLGKVLWPTNLCFCYPRWNDILARGVWAFLPLAALVALLAWLWWRRHTALRHVLVALACYIVMLLPILGLHPKLNIFFMRYSLVSDHWQYPATPILIAFVVGVLAWLYLRARPGVVLALRYALMLVLPVLACYSAYLAGVYRTADSVWTHTIRCNPAAWLAYSNLAFSRLEKWQATRDEHTLVEAIDYFTSAQVLAPHVGDNYANLASVWSFANRRAMAARVLQEGLSRKDLAPREQAQLEEALGTAVLDTSDPAKVAEAAAHYYRATVLDPQFQRAFYRLAWVLDQLHDPGALAAARRAVELKPKDSEAAALLRKVDNRTRK